MAEVSPWGVPVNASNNMRCIPEHDMMTEDNRAFHRDYLDKRKQEILERARAARSGEGED